MARTSNDGSSGAGFDFRRWFVAGVLAPFLCILAMRFAVMPYACPSIASDIGNLLGIAFLWYLVAFIAVAAIRKTLHPGNHPGCSARKLARARKVMAAMAATFLAGLILVVMFVPGFDGEQLDRTLSYFHENHPSIHFPGKLRIQMAGLLHWREESFRIFLDPKYELLVLRVSRERARGGLLSKFLFWSKPDRVYKQWRLYAEPLHRKDYMESAKSRGEALTPTDYCRYYFSELARKRAIPGDFCGPWNFRDAMKGKDGRYYFYVGRSHIAGSGLLLIIDKDGNVLEERHLFSPM